MKINKIIFVLLIISYSMYGQVNEKNQNTFANKNSIKLKNKIYGKNIYQITLINNSNCINRKYLISKNFKIISEIFVPPEEGCSYFAGLALDGIKEDKKGFQLSIEYGSRYFYYKIFYFKYYNNSFYLYQVKTESFDKANPEIWKTKNTIINPKLKVRKLDLEKYLTCDNMAL